MVVGVEEEGEDNNNNNGEEDEEDEEEEEEDVDVIGEADGVDCGLLDCLGVTVIEGGVGLELVIV